jgi:hypothetical protein
MRWRMGVVPLLAAALAGCTGAAPPADSRAGEAQTVPPGQPPSEFPASHHAMVEGVVTARGGEPLDSITVVAWRMADGRGSLLQLRAETGADGRFRLPLQANVGPDPAFATRVVIRGFAYAARYPRGAGGSVALDSVIIPVTLVPLGQPAPIAQARIILPLP